MAATASDYAVRCMRAVGRSVARTLRESYTGWADLKVTEAKVLVELFDEPGMIAAQIATSIDSDSAHTSRILATMMDKGLIAHSGTYTARRRPFTLTAEGSEAAQRILAKQGPPLASLTRCLSTAEMQALQSMGANMLRGFYGKAPELSLHDANTDDLCWLVGRGPPLYELQEGGRIAELGRRVMDLHEFLGCWEEDRSWVVRNWGERVGGCVLTHDISRDGNANIRLFYVDHDQESHGAKLLLQRAVDAAGDYDTVRIGPVRPSATILDALRWRGFKKVRSQKSSETGRPYDLDTYEIVVRETYATQRQSSSDPVDL